jgi:nucleotide-binding universal stress UspA family protein
MLRVTTEGAMIVLKNILVATDFEAASDAALVYGRALARTFGASLHLLHVAENQFLRPSPSDPPLVKAAQLRSLHERVTDDDRATLRARAVIETSDDPAEAIVAYARNEQVDLIVMGTHGRSAMSQLLVGSVAERVVRLAPCPVLTVRQPEREFVRPDASESETSMILLKQILVATDFSEPSDAALAYGRELARMFGAQLTVLNIVEVVAAAYGADGFVAVEPELQSQIEESARRRISALLSDEDREQLRAQGVVRAASSTALAIVDFARETNTGLIVMGTHGRGAVAHLLMGSVAERVVRTAPCPVLTVRHPEHEFVLPDALVAVAKA